jgi:hypothetical protein
MQLKDVSLLPLTFMITALVGCGTGPITTVHNQPAPSANSAFSKCGPTIHLPEGRGDSNGCGQ